MDNRTAGALNARLRIAEAPLYFPLAGTAGTAATAPAAVIVVAAGNAFFPGFAGRLLPNEPLKIFPFLVFLSPLPILIFLTHRCASKMLPEYKVKYRSKIQKAPVPAQKCPVAELCYARTIKCAGRERHYNFADSSLPALNFATFFALILMTAPV